MNAIQSRRKLLVVDDEPDFAELVRDVGQEVGLQTIVAYDLAQFEERYSPDLNIIVMDLSMPDADGIELTRWLSEQEYSAHLILMSGVDRQILESTKELATARGLNVIGVLQKPVCIDELEALLLQQEASRVDVKSASSAQSFTDETLVAALRNSEILPHYQPKIDVLEERCMGVEALARWEHPVHGVIGAGAFLPRLLELGLAEELAVCMFGAAADDLATLRQDGFDIPVALNVEGEQLVDPEFPVHMSSMASERGLQPRDFVLEVTEHGVVTRLLNAIENVLRLRLRGFSVSIDDYGTGHSTMSQLQRLPFSELKIDKSFVDRLPDCSKSRSIVASTIDLAHRLGLNVVAEGVENAAQIRTLAEMGCNSMQGFLLARPMGLSALRRFLADGLPRLDREFMKPFSESRVS